MANQSNPSALGYTPAEYKKFKKYAVLYLIFFSLIYCATYCTRNNLSAVGPQMIAQLGWSNREIGLLSGVLFWFYAVGQLISGRLCEIIGTNKCIALSVVLSVAVNVAVGFQNSVAVIVVLWGLNGLFQSLAWAPGFAALTRWWPSSSRGFASGFANAFAGFGTVAAQLSVVFALKAAPELGWRAAFFIPAAVPAAALIVFLTVTKPSPERVGLHGYVEQNDAEAEREREMQEIVRTKGALYPFRYVVTRGGFAVWLIVAFVVGVARYGLIDWVPKYFSSVYGMDVTDGLISSLILPVGMGVGTLVLPALSDIFWKNNRIYHVILCAVAGAAATAGFLFLDPRVPAQMTLIQILLFAAGFFIYAINGIAWAVAADVGGRVFSGTSSGILNFTCYLGSAVQAVVYGFLTDSVGWNVVFISIAVFCAVIAVIGGVAARRKR